jgi:hypothetical protein
MGGPAAAAPKAVVGGIGRSVCFVVVGTLNLEENAAEKSEGEPSGEEVRVAGGEKKE